MALVKREKNTVNNTGRWYRGSCVSKCLFNYSNIVETQEGACQPVSLHLCHQLCSRRDRGVSLSAARSRNLLEQQLLERLPRLDRFLLARDHAIEEELKALLKVLNPLQLKTRHLALHQTRHVLEFLLRLQHASLRLLQ
jgi:hypothetical protein